MKWDEMMWKSLFEKRKKGKGRGKGRENFMGSLD